MYFRSAVGICLVFSSFAIGIQNSLAAPAYMNDADTRRPTSTASLPNISNHKFPRVIMAETQSVSGNLEQYSKYQIITTGGGTLQKIAQLQSKYPNIMYFRALMPTEYLEYKYSNYCVHGHSVPFEKTASSTSGCNVYAGHWLYQAGTTLKASINSSTTSVPVADASRFKVGEYVVIYNAPAGSFNNAEHAKITGRNTSNNTLTLQRGFKSSATSHGSGSIIAQHVTGQSGSTQNWSYNISTKCPKDKSGKTYAQAALSFIKSNYNKDWTGGSTTANVSGFLFDSDFYAILKTKKADVNNDLKTDDGKDAYGTNWWGIGLENFYGSVRSAFPNKYLISGHQLARAFNATNGTQMEGWVQSNGYHSVIPERTNLNSELSDYQYYMHYINKGPAASHVLTKTPTKIYPDGTGASSNKPFRFTLGMGLLDDGYYGSQNSTRHPDVWYDEFAVYTDKSSSNYGKAVPSKSTDESAIRKNTGWLGNPLGAYKRIYNGSAFSESASLIAPGTFDSNLNGWAGGNVVITRDASTSRDGAASMLVSKQLSYQSDLFGAKVKGPSASLNKGSWYTLVFSAKSSSPREIKANVGGFGDRFLVGTSWRRYVMSFKAPASGAQKIMFTMGDENTNVWLDTVYLFKGNANVFRRDFNNGIVVVNGTDSSTTVDLGGTFQKIKGNQDPNFNNGQSLSKITLDAWDAAVLIRPKSNATVTAITAPTSEASMDPSDTETCGAPAIATDSDQGIFLWKDCDADSWHLVVSPGGDSNGINFTGSVTSYDGFNMVDPVGFESHDVLNMDSSKIDFDLKVWNKGTDGIDFVLPSDSKTCFSLYSTASGGVYVGPNKVEASSSFDLNTLQQCD